MESAVTKSKIIIDFLKNCQTSATRSKDEHKNWNQDNEIFIKILIATARSFNHYLLFLNQFTHSSSNW